MFKADSHILSFTPDSKEQKRMDEEDFKSLATSPVIEGERYCSQCKLGAIFKYFTKLGNVLTYWLFGSSN